MRVGTLTTKRDFTDVKDMAVAYELALLRGVPGEVYNLGSGVEISIQTLLDLLLRIATVDIKVIQDPEKMLPSDVPRLVANPLKFRQLTGWEATIPLSATLARVLDYWRLQVKGNFA